MLFETVLEIFPLKVDLGVDSAARRLERALSVNIIDVINHTMDFVLVTLFDDLFVAINDSLFAQVFGVLLSLFEF